MPMNVRGTKDGMVTITMTWQEAAELGDFLAMELPRERLGDRILGGAREAVGLAWLHPHNS